ncbi:MAG TPA: hypothetical protein VFP41_01520 [Actinomycetota bacterium]|jgi:hypothetical protein|nr:hypothetical protein [Actinomycetota bacterium]
MDDFMKVRFALDNVRPPEVAEAAAKAFDRILEGEPIADADSPDRKRYEEARTGVRRTEDMMGR